MSKADFQRQQRDALARKAEKLIERQKRPLQRVKPPEAPEQPQNPTSAIMASFGRLGGAARAKALTGKRRTEIAASGARARWAKDGA